MTSLPAGEQHTGTLNLTGHGNPQEAAGGISDEAVENTAIALFAQSQVGEPYPVRWFDNYASKDEWRAMARAALEAAAPAIRQQAAEEIAAAIEAEQDIPHAFTSGVPTAVRDRILRRAATIARDIGGQG